MARLDGRWSAKTNSCSLSNTYTTAGSLLPSLSRSSASVTTGRWSLCVAMVVPVATVCIVVIAALLNLDYDSHTTVAAVTADSKDAASMSELSCHHGNLVV